MREPTSRSRRPKPKGALAACALAAVVAVIGTTAARATSPGENGQIVFAATVGRHLQLFTIQPDGSGQTQITHFRDGSDTLNASWSPDGNRIVFERDFSYPHAGIYTMEADGTNVRSLTANKRNFFEGVPGYAPDGKRIVFDRTTCSNTNCNGPRDHNELVVANGNGGAARRVTQPLLNGPQGDHFFDFPRFSPDGKRIAYVKRLGHKAAVFVMNANGAGVKQLTSFRMSVDDRLDWSPDGAKILFSDNLRAVDVYTVRANGTGLTQITHSTGGNYSAKSWSPDGKQILFVLGHPGAGRPLYVMNADGSEMKQVTKGLLVQGGSWGTHP